LGEAFNDRVTVAWEVGVGTGVKLGVAVAVFVGEAEGVAVRDAVPVEV